MTSSPIFLGRHVAQPFFNNSKVVIKRGSQKWAPLGKADTTDKPQVSEDCKGLKIGIIRAKIKLSLKAR